MSSTARRVWHCCGREVSLQRPLIMGVVNVTPDSLSDGGSWFDSEKAVAHALELAAQGADILDFGGESTRPGAVPVALDEERRRVIPVVREVAHRCDTPISIDTRHAVIAKEALDAGAVIINNIMEFAASRALVEVARQRAAGLVIMHIRGTPQSMVNLTTYHDVVAQVEEALSGALAQADALGLRRDTIVVDPGIGFAKDSAQGVKLLAATARLARLAPLLVGASRKSFIGDLCDEPLPQERLGGSIAAALWCAQHGASILRLHDVKAARQALQVFDALQRAHRSLFDDRQDDV